MKPEKFSTSLEVIMRTLRLIRLIPLVPLVIAALLAVLSAPLFAADATAAQPKLFVLHQEAVRPGQIKVYEDTTKEFVAALQQHRSSIPGFAFSVVMGDDFTYNYLSQVPDFAYAGSVYSMLDKVGQEVGAARWGDLMQRNGAAVDSVSDSFFVEDPSLSYSPAAPRLKPEEERFLHFDLYYVQPGREMEADAVARDFAALFRAKKMANGYRLMKLAFGHGGPLLVVAVPARDAEDYAAQDGKDRAALGAEGQALFNRAFALTRRFERHDGWVRPDLSLPPAGK
jgi:hypothetical protein